MTEDSKQSGKGVSLFNDESVNKLKDIITKLEGAESLEAAKLLVVEFNSFVEGVEPEKEEAKEEPAKEEPVKEGDSEEAKPEDKPEEGTEEKKDEPVKDGESKEEPAKEEVKEEASQETDKGPVEKTDLKTQLCDALDLNGKMLGKLKEAESSIMTLQKINEKIKADNSQLTTDLDKSKNELSVFVKEKEVQTQEKYNSKFKSVFTQYCEFMDVEETEKESVREMMSTYSEGMLDKTASFLDKKETAALESEPDVQTQASSDLASGEPALMTREMYDKLNAREKTDHLFSLMQN